MNGRFVALHFSQLRFEEPKFQQSLSHLESTRYSLRATDEDAPGVSHCISAVRYIVMKSTGFSLPHEYIGDFCSNMLYHQVAGARLIPLEEAELGDLVFFHRRALAHKVHMISHVGVFVDGDGNYFHSSPKGGKVDNISDSLIKGTIVTCRLALKRTDPR